ncbi:hypothetical protein MMC13_007461 [Lambiella insularis]|nr:hypothetical protein [Lambiella insularis]
MINGGISSDNPYGTCLFEAPLKNTMSSIDPLQELKLLKELTVSSPPSTTFIFHISLLDIVAQGGLSNQYHQAIAELKQLLAELIGPSVAQASTVVFTAGASKHSKRVVNDYGSYIVPVSNLGIREQQEEEPLSFAHRPASSSPVSHDSTRSQTLVLKSSIRPKVTMPICHSTNSSCMSTTENCSGHGTCYKKNPDPSDDSAQDCWACGCTPSVRKNEEGGIKTTHWGGPACQKKDVSAPFFLLAGFTITMVAALSWGVGLMYSIGEEELPSVIGAGVAGPRAQK